MIAPQAVNPMQGGAGSSPAAGGPPPPMGQPAGQQGAPPPAMGPGSQPGQPQMPAAGIGVQEILAKAQAALKAGQISQQEYNLIVQKLKMAMGAGGAGGPPAAMAQPAIGSPSPAWGQ